MWFVKNIISCHPSSETSNVDKHQDAATAQYGGLEIILKDLVFFLLLVFKRPVVMYGWANI